MATNGYQSPAGGTPDAGTTVAGQQRAYVADPMPAHGWLYRLTGRMGRSGASNATLAMAVWATTSGNPGVRKGKTASFTVSTPMTSGSDGAEFARDLEAVVQGFSGIQLAYGYLGTANGVRHGMIADANPLIVSAVNTLFYDRFGVSQPPTDPHGYTVAINEGHLALWADYEANANPDNPAVVTVSGTSSTDAGTPASIGTFSPVLVWQFRDDNESVGSGPVFGVGFADKLKRGQVQVINSDGSLKWDSGVLTATGAEQTARAMTRTYAGSALTAGLTYKVRTKVLDLFDAASDWSAYRYFVVAAGAMTSPTTPTGKQETRQPTPFVATWTHTGALSTNAVQIRIKDAVTGTVLRDSGTLTKTVANNASSSVTWATTAFADLDYGTNAVWEMRGRDTASNWGSYSVAQAFTVDAAPSIPDLPQPLTPAVSLPLVYAYVSDVDDDNTTGLIVKLEIKNSGGTVLFTRTMTFVSKNATTGISTFSYQITSTDWATFATFKLTAYAYDGTVYSGGTTVEASATRSTERTVVYASGPIPTITSPADAGTITTDVPTITWTVSGTQVKRRVIITRASVVIHDTGDVTTGVLSYTIPSTLSTGADIHEGDVLAITVTVTNATPLAGSDVNTVTVDYATPTSLTPTASLEYAAGDAIPSVVAVTWPATDYPLIDAGAGAFLYYRLTRTPSADALAANPDLSPETVNFGRLPIGQTRYEDHAARSGVEYVWALKQFVQVGVDRIGSVEVETVATINFNTTIIHDVRDPAGTRIVLGARKDRTITPQSDMAVLMPWGQEKPIHLHGEVFYHEVECEYTLLVNTQADANAIVRRAQQMAKGGPLLWRDGRGNAFFGEFMAPPIEIDPKGGGPRRLRVQYRELAWDESVITDD